MSLSSDREGAQDSFRSRGRGDPLPESSVCLWTRLWVKPRQTQHQPNPALLLQFSAIRFHKAKAVGSVSLLLGGIWGKEGEQPRWGEQEG